MIDLIFVSCYFEIIQPMYIKKRNYRHFIIKARQQNGDNLPLLPLLFRLFIWILKNRGRVTMFFYLNLHKKGRKLKDYITEPEYRRIYRRIYPQYYSALLEDKYVFDRFLKSYDFPLAELVARIQDRKIHWINNEIVEPLENIINFKVNCFLKMYLNWGGTQVYKIQVENRKLFINNKESNIQSLQKIVGDNIFILQQTVIQHPEMNRLNSSCINTLRIVTIQVGEEIKIIEKITRIGIRGSIVDNASQGNLICGIHDDGTLYETASSHHIDLFWITHHPETNVEFKSFKVPYFQESIELTIRLHKVFHCFLTVAWDIAVSESGPVIIEGNPLGDILWPQILLGGMKKEILDYVSNFKIPDRL